MSARLDIDIRVQIPEPSTPDQRVEFIEGVMKAFRETFPNAEPLLPVNIDVPSPVTVRFNDDEPDNAQTKMNT